MNNRPTSCREVPLSNGGVALVDVWDYEKVMEVKGWYHMKVEGRKSSYAAAKTYENGKEGLILMHRLIRTPSPGEEINHKDENGLNNQQDNLESVTHSVNIRKSHDTRGSKNHLGRGVYVCGSGRYVATIAINGKRTHIGTYDTLEEARSAYEERRSQLI